ncbi:MAG: G-D-S-L family lipolytic protein [Chitinophaga sp.]|jgi:isoamyl acetate esterase|nr:G-D-S-L family lipolytic protein [Chitinophaga sp.]
MKKTIALATVTLSVICFSFIQPKKTKVVFFGDSITQQGAGKTGYIPKIDSLSQLEGLNNNYEFIGAGVGGNRVYDLYLRIEADVLEKKPDVVLIYIGINDVWHKTTSGTGTEPAKYETFYRAIIKKLQAQNIKVILCTPTVIGEKNDVTNLQDGDLNKYSNIVRSIAKSLSLPVCDLRVAFTEYLKNNNPNNLEKGVLTVDGVHLTPAGNLLVAQEMWKAIKQLK